MGCTTVTTAELDQLLGLPPARHRHGPLCRCCLERVLLVSQVIVFGLTALALLALLVARGPRGALATLPRGR